MEKIDLLIPLIVGIGLISLIYTVISRQVKEETTNREAVKVMAKSKNVKVLEKAQEDLKNMQMEVGKFQEGLGVILQQKKMLESAQIDLKKTQVAMGKLKDELAKVSKGL
jgi:hypothetical protein